MEHIQLLKQNTPPDLVLRGFSQDEILQQTGFDVGYHGNKVKTKLLGIDRFAYKVTYVNAYYDRLAVQSVLDEYANGLEKEQVLRHLGIAGANIVKLHKLFDALGYSVEFKEADKQQRLRSMRRGTIEKYGTDNVFHLSEFQEKAAQTREDKYGGRYTLSKGSILADGARETYKEHMADSEFADAVIAKRKETTLKHHGVSVPAQSAVVRDKMKQTMVERYGVEYYTQSDDVREQYSERMLSHNDSALEKSRKTMLERYGVDNWSQTVEARQQQSERMRATFVERNAKARTTCLSKYGVLYASQRPERRLAMSLYMKKHVQEFLEKSKQTRLAKYGVEFVTQLPEYRERQSQRMLDCNYQKRIIQSKKSNGILNTSEPELMLKQLLIDCFGESDVFTQYQDIRYPFMCDFYIQSRDLFIELNAVWTHGGHWYNSTNTGDVVLSDLWSHNDSEFYQNAYKNWTIRDVDKRQYAADNQLNYVVFWCSDLSDVVLWIAMGCPDGQDWKQEYSWLPDRQLNSNFEYPALQVGSKICVAIAKAANGLEFYHRELQFWSDNPYRKIGTVQSQLYANRYRYLNKLPDELSDKEILRGLNISGIVRGYSVFDNTGMVDVLKDYDVHFVYDPCAGWGERLATAGALGLQYYGCDINQNVVNGHREIIKQYHLQNCDVVCMDAACHDMTMSSHDCVFTCPPYADTEIYTEHGAENLDYQSFLDWWKQVVLHSIGKDTRVFAYQISQKYKDDINQVLLDLGWQLDKQIPVSVNNVSHMNRGQGVTKKQNYEEVQVFVRNRE